MQSEIRTIGPAPGFVSRDGSYRLDSTDAGERQRSSVVALASTTMERVFSPEAKATLEPPARSPTPDELEIVSSKPPRVTPHTLGSTRGLSLELTLGDTAPGLLDRLQSLETRDE